MATKFTQAVFTLLTLAGFTGGAEAHAGHGSTVGFMAGFAHPLSGLDHILAMVCVGLFAARLGGRAIWAVPLAFVAMVAVGGVLGMNGIALPYVEFVITASVIVLAAAATMNINLSTLAAAGLVGSFALFHGIAHGAEMPVPANATHFGLGFISATILLHGLGLALGLSTRHQVSQFGRARGAVLIK